MTALATGTPATGTLAIGTEEAPARTPRRGPGRPRNEDIDAQVLAAVLELIDDKQDVTAARIVERSGVSRAALYRRWPSLTTLIAAALDVGREMPPAIPADGNLRDAILETLLGATAGTGPVDYPDERFRQRIRLALADRELQKAYWTSHVSRRRAPIENALRTGIERGELRADLDPEACFDLIAGVFYYQLVVRGDHLDDGHTRARCRSALDVAWRGMVSGGQPGTSPFGG
ncbi:TetR/AcrR family transcriptional regulator [Arthrobacter sp. P2b]|uniref:TetR/AcrR family transcriptional regulator n=1 Tax=Arthrobacter sp. P2b TaxID=1938741 RepID=UPI0009A5DBAF|nr:TetR/AcrR family transcriptional regulator [Arthrobacter sp. P2b]SLK07173.1 transcriptional regulator, TetR family [Arthrobacter sp. P2b]